MNSIFDIIGPVMIGPSSSAWQDGSLYIREYAGKGRDDLVWVICKNI